MGLKLNVPYKEKDEAKLKGAFWDINSKVWYVPSNKNYNDFHKWIDKDKFSLIAKSPFYVALNERTCWKCGQSTKVIALASNNFYEYDYTSEDENDLSMEWLRLDFFSFFSNPTYINQEVIQLLQQKFSFFKLGFSKTINGKYWANHCEKCNALQGDFFNHNEPGGAFFPTTTEECMEIKLIEVPSKFDLTINADYSMSSIEEMIFEYSEKLNWE